VPVKKYLNNFLMQHKFDKQDEQIIAGTDLHFLLNKEVFNG